MPAPVILFGAFDRHNFGDLLFPHVLEAMLGTPEVRHAGLAARDMRSFGGHRVEALADLAQEFAGRPVRLIHVGGEILTCTNWEVAVMLQPPAEAAAAQARLGSDPRGAQDWAASVTGTTAHAPYVVGPARFPGAQISVHAAGGVGMPACDATLQTEVHAQLRVMRSISVRDRTTSALLRAAGIACELLPDPAIMLAPLFGSRIAARLRDGPAAQLRARFPGGYCAAQFSTEFADAGSLAALAAAYDAFHRASGCGIVFFVAGSAPWHDDPALYEEVIARMQTTQACIFPSLNLWDTCSLIAGSRLYAGSSLHGRIVAMSCGLPRVSLLPPAPPSLPQKQAEFAATWEPEEIPLAVPLERFAQGMVVALAVSPGLLQDTAARLAAQYRARFEL